MRLIRTDINSITFGESFTEDPPMYLVRHDGCIDSGQFYSVPGLGLTFVPVAGDVYDFMPNEIWEIVDED